MRERYAQLAGLFDKLKQGLSTAVDLMVLNLLLLLCCIPVFTVGAAESACYACLMRIARGEQQQLPFGDFFKAFRDAFPKATPIWLAQLLCLALLAGDLFYAVYVCDPVNKFFLVFAIVLGAVALSAASWAYPLTARFNKGVKGQIKNAFLMAFAHFPKTLLALLLHALLWSVPFLLWGLFVYFGWFWLLFGLSLPRYWTVLLFRDALQLPKKKQEQATLPNAAFTAHSTNGED